MHLLTGCFPHGLTSHRQWQKYALFGKICNGDLGYGDMDRLDGVSHAAIGCKQKERQTCQL
jgi:hypothetical protein